MILNLYQDSGNPHSQGDCERVHQTIIRDFIPKLLDNTHYDFNNIERDYQKTIYNYNNIKHSRASYKPSLLFYNNI